MQPKSRPPATRGNLALLNSAEVASDPLSAALDYSARGWSVFPLKGNERGKDYQDGKTPAVKWAVHQRHAPDQQQITEWFQVIGHTAIGIVLGSVSGICVCEFDNPAKQLEFEQRFSHLLDTLTHISGKRRGKHFIFRLPPELMQVQSRNIAGVGEFKANGQYIVAPPTKIKGYAWEVLNDSDPKTLTIGDVEQIIEFYEVDQKTAQSDDSAPLVILPTYISGDGLTAFYHAQRERLPRNASAYRTMQQAARSGWQLEDAIAAIVADFVTDLPDTKHDPETPEKRSDELRRTAASAYHKIPVAPGTYQADGRGLSNSVREYLLQQPKVKGQPHGANHARIMDMLLLTGLQPGQRFTEKSAMDCGAFFGIGRPTIRKALDWLEGIQRDITVLRTGENVANAPLASLSIQDKTPNKGTDFPILHCEPDITMLCIWKIDSFNPQRGRPTKIYTLPEITDLCAVLGVKVTHGDKLELSDLKSAKAYRVGLQRALVARSEDKQIGRRWMAERLGVNVRTVYSYDEPAGIEPISQEVVTPITWRNLNMIPIDPYEDQGKDKNGKPIQNSFGYYLRIGNTKRPPKRAYAHDALDNKQTVEYVQRRPNKYKLKAKPEAVQDDPLIALAKSLGGELKP